MARIIFTGERQVHTNILIVPTTGKRFFEFIPPGVLTMATHPLAGIGVRGKTYWLLNVQNFLYKGYMIRNKILFDFMNLCMERSFTHVMFTIQNNN